MAEDRRLTEPRDRTGHVEASETKRSLDVMNVAAPVPSEPPAPVVPDPAASSQSPITNCTAPPDYDG
jgi:hypothetical protein